AAGGVGRPFSPEESHSTRLHAAPPGTGPRRFHAAGIRVIVLWIVLAISVLASIVLFAARLAIVDPPAMPTLRGGGAGAAGAALPISILKPLKGSDPGLEENLESFYLLDYPEFEIVFSFASRDDEAFPVARRVADRHPEIPTAF